MIPTKKIMAVLGDSIAFGVGAGETPEEMAQKGFAGLVAQEKGLQLFNHSKPGAETGDIL